MVEIIHVTALRDVTECSVIDRLLSNLGTARSDYNVTSQNDVT